MSRDDYLKRRYGGSQSFLNRREHEFVADMLGRIGPQNRVLDLPCGHGRFTPQLRGITTEKLSCADYNQVNIDAMLAAESDTGVPIEAINVDLFQTIPFEDNEFDLVFNFRFFHHIEDDGNREHVVKELARVSKRYLIISYYHTAPIHTWQKRLWKRKGHVAKLPMIDQAEFRRLFNAQSCHIVEERGVLPGIHAHRVVLLEKR